MLDNKTLYSVYEVNKSVGTTLLRNYSSIWVKGEISSLKKYSSGHYYFTLKDDKSELKCVLFSRQRATVLFSMKNGDKVTILGNISVYINRGYYQLRCLEIINSGNGKLWQQFLILKQMLKDKGIFSMHRELPKYPLSIGIISSIDGSVIEDFKRILQRRSPFTQINIYPSSVQGDDADKNIIKGINYFNNSNNVEAIVIARGGGSMEDLWCFNSEKLAYSIYSSCIPVISAIGHETDFTICDYASDVRAATPSEAAEIISKNNINLNKHIDEIKNRIDKLFEIYIILFKQKILGYLASLEIYSPKSLINELKIKIQNIKISINQLIDKEFNNLTNRIMLNDKSINILNPKNILQKGYSITSSNIGKIISNISMVKIDDDIYVRLKDGKIKARINNIEVNTVGKK